MKKVVIVHGWGGNSKYDWIPWLKQELESKDFEVVAPDFSDSDEPEIDAWVGKLKEVSGDVDENTFFVGHSIGCQTILRFLERIDRKVGSVVLVAPWLHLNEKIIEEEGEEVVEIARQWIETSIDFEKVRKMAERFVCIFSDDDPYVPLSDEEIFKKELNAETVVEERRGHFNDVSLPLLLEYLK